MKSFLVRWLLLGGMLLRGLLGGPLVGDIFFVDAGNGTTQFFLDNFTGASDGCSTPAGFPVCTSLSFSGTLTYSYLSGADIVNGTAALLVPIGPNSENGGAAYSPAGFTLPSTTVLSAFFSGSFAPAALLLDTGSFLSNGLLTSPDIVSGGGYALLSTELANAIPEPGSVTLLLLAGLGLALRGSLGRHAN